MSVRARNVQNIYDVIRPGSNLCHACHISFLVFNFLHNFSFNFAEQLLLVVNISVPNGFPRIVENPTLKAVEKDRNTVMLCSAAGDPEPSITWLKDFIPVDTSDPRLKILTTG